MKFFHVYNDDMYKGLVKNDMMNKDTGFKLQNAFCLPYELRFSEYAKKGSNFYNLIKEKKIPVYVDRFAGGINWFENKLDKDLIEEYKKILGKWFLGFQLHESASNRRHDWNQMIKNIGGKKGPYDKDELDKAMFNPIAWEPDGTKLHYLQQDSVDYYSKQKYSETYEEFFEEVKSMFKRRMEDTNNSIVPCDSYYVATKLQNDLGYNTFMPEVGCQIAQTRVQVAVARGIASLSDKTWGLYYECWRELKNVGYCMPCYNNDPSNEWYLPQEMWGDDFSSYGPNGGSSRLLQDRIYHYALMSGADYFSEEWGLNCSYSDMKEFTLSHYGQVKKDFIKRAETMQGIKAKVPFAIVLPNKYSVIEIFDMFHPWIFGEHRTEYMQAPLSKEEIEYFGHIEDVLKFVFARVDEIGNEGHAMTNSRFGDLFDIIYEDTDMANLSKYACLIDATKEGSFIKAKEGTNLKILDSFNFDKLAKEIEAIAKEVMPVYVDGLHWLVSTDENNRNFLTIFNNEGNERDIDKGDIIHDEADKVVKVEFKNAVDLKVLFNSLCVKNAKVEKVDDKSYNVLVPAAGYVVLGF